MGEFLGELRLQKRRGEEQLPFARVGARFGGNVRGGRAPFASGVFAGVVAASSIGASVSDAPRRGRARDDDDGGGRRADRERVRPLARSADGLRTPEGGRRSAHPARLGAAENVDAATRAAVQMLSLDDPNLGARVAVRSGLVQLRDAGDRLQGEGNVQSFRRRRRGRRGRRGPPRPALRVQRDRRRGERRFGELPPEETSAALLSLSDSLGALLDRARLRAEVARLDRSIRLRDERQTACAVHDLGQPLNVMVLSATYVATLGDSAWRPWLDRVCASGLLLERLIADLRDSSFLEAGSLSLRLGPVEIVDLVKAATGRHARNAHVSVAGAAPSLDLDAQRVEQVLANLLVNAEKYGRPESPPLVEVACLESEVVVSVSNEGESISDEERSRIFDPNHRALDRRLGAPGLGLGLYICKMIVEAHGGRIWAESAAPVTRFSFSFPVHRAADAGEAWYPRGAQVANGARSEGYRRGKRFGSEKRIAEELTSISVRHGGSPRRDLSRQAFQRWVARLEA